ncbi:MAG: pseudouridine synthase, partial [Prevotella salivae]|nr:pseudouridine synthase [Segatella salivae]
MDSELENKTQDLSTEQNETTREGYSRQGGSYSSSYHATGRPQRPRIHSQRAYSTDHVNTNEVEGGFRPEGFGSGLQGNERPQRSYQPRQGGYGRTQGGYNNNRPGNYGRPQVGGYHPRYNNEGDEMQGGYQPRMQGGYNRPQQGGYRPRYTNNPDDQQGGYQPRSQGGYG